MKNTPENKAKFFALYWGQKVLRFNFKDRRYSKTLLSVNLDLKHVYITEGILELKDPLKIEDAHAAHIGIILNDYIVSAYQDDLKYCKQIITRMINTRHRLSNIEVIDYLRLKGYAVPWMGLSVEQLLEYGWIKLI